MALTTNEKQLCELVQALEAMLGVWEQTRQTRDCPNHIDAELQRLDGQRQAAAAKCADSLAQYRAQ